MERRLPVYLLLDCSGSMSGEPINAMQIGLDGLVNELRGDPFALETVWMSIITFGSFADQVVPLCEICEFDIPHLEAGGSTALGDALQLLEEQIHREVRLTSDGYKADWKPLVFLFTDGEPTDDWREPARLLRDGHRVQLIACGAGPQVNMTTLKQLSDTVLHLENTQPGTLSSFLKWVTTSVTSQPLLSTRLDGDSA